MTALNTAIEGKKNGSPWPTFAVCAIASYISTLDMSIVNVAFAEIARSFPGVSQSTISWVVTSYSILYGSLLVVSGRLADRVGRKRLFQFGTVLFLFGSLMCALASEMGMLIAGRAVQGVGGAMMTPASLGLLLAAFPIEKRSQTVAWSGAIGALGVASGPTLGAFFISTFGWRSAFWINIPICIGVVVMAWRVVRESPKQPGTRPDVLASILVTLSVASLVWSISRVETFGWTHRSVVVLFIIAILFGAVVAYRSMHHAEPLLPPALFRQRTFTVANISTFLFGAAFSANILNNVLFLRTIWGYSVLRAGWFSVLAPVIVATTSFAIGRHVSRIGFRKLLIGGPAMFAIVVLIESILIGETPTPWTRWLPIMFVLGISIGATFPVLSAATVMGLPQTQFALGGAINNTFRQIGAAVGVAIVVTVQTSTDGIGGFRNGWYLIAICGLLASFISTLQPRPE